MDIRGTVPSQERITAKFSDVTLGEALSRIMRGYNYVLVRPEESARILLVVMNKVEWSTQREPAAAAKTPAAPVPAPSTAPGAMPVQGGRPRPGGQQAPPGERQDTASQVVGPTATGDVAQPKPATPLSAPGSGVLSGQGAAPSDTAPGATQPSSPGAGGLSPRPSVLPRTSIPPAEGAGRSAPQSVSSSHLQESVQRPSEPTKVMTPFGERLVEPADTGPQVPVQAPQQPAGPTPITAPDTAAPQGKP
jgi:hypothetical protein